MVTFSSVFQARCVCLACTYMGCKRDGLLNHADTSSNSRRIILKLIATPAFSLTRVDWWGWILNSLFTQLPLLVQVMESRVSGALSPPRAPQRGHKRFWRFLFFFPPFPLPPAWAVRVCSHSLCGSNMVKTAMQRSHHREERIYNAWIKSKEHKASKSRSQWAARGLHGLLSYNLASRNDWKYQQSETQRQCAAVLCAAQHGTLKRPSAGVGSGRLVVQVFHILSSLDYIQKKNWYFFEPVYIQQHSVVTCFFQPNVMQFSSKCPSQTNSCGQH